MLEIDGLVKQFGTLNAVDSISLTIPPGTIYGFVGPNGAGKTTTIRLLTLGTRPTSGTIRFMGKEIHDDPIVYKCQFGYAAAEPFLYDLLTGREFLNFVADLRKMAPDARGSIERFIELFELGGDADRLITSYSSGMKRKVAVIAAMIHTPPLLFLDEPTNALDAISVRRLKDALIELKQQGTTIFLTTHVLEVVEKLADRIGIIHRGRKVGEGTLTELMVGHHESNRQLEDVLLALTEQPATAPSTKTASG